MDDDVIVYILQNWKRKGALFASVHLHNGISQFDRPGLAEFVERLFSQKIQIETSKPLATRLS